MRNLDNELSQAKMVIDSYYMSIEQKIEMYEKYKKHIRDLTSKCIRTFGEEKGTEISSQVIIELLNKVDNLLYRNINGRISPNVIAQYMEENLIRFTKSILINRVKRKEIKYCMYVDTNEETLSYLTGSERKILALELAYNISKYDPSLDERYEDASYILGANKIEATRIYMDAHVKKAKCFNEHKERQMVKRNVKKRLY